MSTTPMIDLLLSGTLAKYGDVVAVEIRDGDHIDYHRVGLRALADEVRELRAELAAATDTLARLTERLREIPLYEFEASGGGSMHNRCGLLTLVPEGHRQYSDGSEFVRWSDIRAAVAHASAPEAI